MNPNLHIRSARCFIATALLVVHFAIPPLAVAAGFERDSLDVAFRGLADKSILPAFGVVAVERDGDQYSFFHGKAVWDGDKPLTADSIFRIYSMTKPIASVAAMQLVEQGKIGLDDSLEKWLPEMMAIPVLQPDGNLVRSDRPITLRHLLTHTSGFAYPFTNRALASFKKPDDWKYKDGPRVFEPGSKWNYGTGTDWVGRLIEKVSGIDLETYLVKHITGPLKMSRTFFVVPAALQDDIVSIGDLVSSEVPKISEAKSERKSNTTPSEYSAGSGLFSTPRDYAVFLRMLLNDGSLNGVRILKKETLEAMARNQIGDISISPIPNFAGRDKWGLAWAIETRDQSGVQAFGTLYWAGIANTYFSIDRAKGRAVMLFSNFRPFASKHATMIFDEAQRMFYR